MKREEELITSDDDLAYNIGLEIRYAIAASGVDPIQHIPEVDVIIKRRIAEIRTLNNSPKPEPVGWETDAEWELEMRCANITEATPFAEVSKLINDLWQQYCLAAEPKPEATEGGAHEKGRLAEAANALLNNLWVGVYSGARTHEENWSEFNRRYPGVKWLHDEVAASAAKQTDGRAGE